MKTFAIWAVAAALAAVAGTHGSCLAGENPGAGAPNIVGALAGNVVANAVLGSQHARGASNININTTTSSTTAVDGSGGDGAAFNDGLLRGNAVIGSSATGMVTATNSVNNNAGVTMVVENSGNNSLFQQSTAINITLAK